MKTLKEYKESAISKLKAKKTTSIIVGLLLLSVVTYAAYTVTTARLNVTVGEAFTAQYAYVSPGSTTTCAAATPYQDSTGSNTFDITGVSGDTAKICVKVHNKGSASIPLTVSATNYNPTMLDIGTVGDCVGPLGAGAYATCEVLGTIKTDSPPGTAAVDISVTRG